MKTCKMLVKKRLPDSYCVKLNDGTGFIVWPAKIQPRGFEQAAIGLGKSPRQAWKNALLGMIEKTLPKYA